MAKKKKKNSFVYCNMSGKKWVHRSSFYFFFLFISKLICTFLLSLCFISIDLIVPVSIKEKESLYFVFSMFDARFSVVFLCMFGKFEKKKKKKKNREKKKTHTKKKTEGFRDIHVTVNTANLFRLNSVCWAINVLTNK